MMVFILELWLMTKLSIPKSLTFSSSSLLLFFLLFLATGLIFFFCSYLIFQNLIRPSFPAVSNDCGLSFKKSLCKLSQMLFVHRKLREPSQKRDWSEPYMIGTATYTCDTTTACASSRSPSCS